MSDTGIPAAGNGPTIESLSEELVRIRIGDKEFVIDAACPHRKGRLVHGYVNERNLRITCPLHRTSFDLTTGRVVAGPGTDPLTVHSVRDWCERQSA